MKSEKEWAKEWDVNKCCDWRGDLTRMARRIQADAIREIPKALWPDSIGCCAVHPSESVKMDAKKAIEYIALCVEKGTYNASGVK